MIKHYILKIDPQANCDWDRCVLRNPITGERPDLTAAIAQALGNKPGSYLVRVNIDVEVLETSTVAANIPEAIELPTAKKAIAQPNKLLAS